MQKFKALAGRGVSLAAALGLFGGVAASAAFPMLAAADALNPLTERTLLLSSSAPGFVDTDGSGNSTYAPPGSGPNGKKTGETFTFKISTTELTGTASTHIKAFTLQYCTTAAGTCAGPGDDSGDPGGSDDTSHSDFNIVTGSGGHAPSEVTAIPTSGSTPPGGVNPDDSDGTFGIEYSTDSGSTWTLSPGWELNDTTANSANVTTLEDPSPTTGKNNFATFTNSSHYMGWDGATQNDLVAGTEIKIQFFATDNNYLTNPGSDAYFVKINDYSSDEYQNFNTDYPYAIQGSSPTASCGGSTGLTATQCDSNVIDGGVTVANIMNNSIQIRTKVLETLDFSVGTNDPDTQTAVQLGQAHGPCDPVNNGTFGQSGGILYLGNPSAENSLATNRGYDTFSYWRLSSNSSNGATVYYSGATLSDTESDQIGQIYSLAGGHSPGDDSAEYTHPGSEQFGLGLDVKYQASLDSQGDNGYLADYTVGDSPDGGGGANAGVHPVDTTAVSGFGPLVTANNPTSNYFNSWHLPELFPLVPMGAIGADQDGGYDAHNTLGYGIAKGSIGVAGAGARFAFNKNANTIPVPIASESSLVVNCSTGFMRYLGNIAATTPAGIYTTAVNYLAAPEY